jgi:hypothetical protein
MTENQKRILEMVAEKKITVDEASRLLNALSGEESTAKPDMEAQVKAKNKPRYLRVTVMPDPEHENSNKVDRVNIRVPVSLIRAGIKLTSLIPPEARGKVTEAMHEKGMDFDMRNLKPEDLDAIVDALNDLEVDVLSSNGEKVKVFVEQ